MPEIQDSGLSRAWDGPAGGASCATDRAVDPGGLDSRPEGVPYPIGGASYPGGGELELIGVVTYLGVWAPYSTVGASYPGGGDPYLPGGGPYPGGGTP